MRARLLINPASGRGQGGKAAVQLAAGAQRHGVPCEMSTSAHDLVERARRAVDDGVERLLVAGGDGTWHWAAQSLAGSDTALAPIPVGTGNDLARELGVPLEAERALESACSGAITRIDLGRLDDEWFCCVAGLGFDAAVADYARTRLRWLRGPLVYVWALLATLPRYRAPRVRLETDSGTVEGEVFLVAFANASHYGGGMRIAPQADPCDGLLDVVVVHRSSKLHLLRVFPRVYRGTHLSDPCVQVIRASRAMLRVAPAQSINLDGESGGQSGDAAVEAVAVRGALAVVPGPGKHNILCKGA